LQQYVEFSADPTELCIVSNLKITGNVMKDIERYVFEVSRHNRIYVRRRAEHSRLATEGPPKRRPGPRECIIGSEWPDVLNLSDEKGQVNYHFPK